MTYYWNLLVSDKFFPFNSASIWRLVLKAASSRYTKREILMVNIWRLCEPRSFESHTIKMIIPVTKAVSFGVVAMVNPNKLVLSHIIVNKLLDQAMINNNSLILSKYKGYISQRQKILPLPFFVNIMLVLESMIIFTAPYLTVLTVYKTIKAKQSIVTKNRKYTRSITSRDFKECFNFGYFSWDLKEKKSYIFIFGHNILNFQFICMGYKEKCSVLWTAKHLFLVLSKSYDKK